MNSFAILAAVMVSVVNFTSPKRYPRAMSALQPPNFRQLNDTIVGNVNQRLRPTRFNGGDEQMSIYRETLIQGSFTTEYSTRPRTPTNGTTARPTLAQSTIDVNAPAAAELERRKERNRMHQARYKQKQNMQMTGLGDNIRQLQDEIQELQLQRQLMSLVPTNKNSWSLAAEYFRLFRFGVKPSASVAQLHAAPEGVYPFDPRAQRDFLLATMSPDVTDGTVSGVDAIMESWKRMSLCCPGLGIMLTCLENGPEGSIIATTEHSHTISECMLHNAFPHLIRTGGEYSQLVNKLLGHQILIQGTVHFEWDSDNGRVSSFLFKADLVTPMLRLLGNLEDVSHVFNNARLTPECGVVGGGGL